MFCPECGDAVDTEDVCRGCGVCDACCDCDEGSFDADEFGEDPEAEYERRFESASVRIEAAAYAPRPDYE